MLNGKLIAVMKMMQRLNYVYIPKKNTHDLSVLIKFSFELNPHVRWLR